MIFCDSFYKKTFPSSLSEPVYRNIFQFEPQSGPVEGGTRIEIRGRDLGLSLSEVKGRVFVGGSKCEVIEFDIASR